MDIPVYLELTADDNPPEFNNNNNEDKMAHSPLLPQHLRGE